MWFTNAESAWDCKVEWVNASAQEVLFLLFFFFLLLIFVVVHLSCFALELQNAKSSPQISVDFPLILK